MNERPLILVADDSAVVRAVVHAHLSAHGFEVIEAVDGLGAVDAFRARRPDVVLLDVEMPGLDGFGVLAAIKEDAVSADTPVVFLTARDGTKDLVEALEHGAHDYLRKPFDENELLARVRAAHRVKTLQDELRLRNGELAVMSRTDPLTGLWNRRYVEEQMPGAESLARRHGTPLSAIMIDIDHFKMINDTVGHAGGDVVLTEVARRLKGCVRTEDLLARWGGEEFLAVLPLGGPDGAMSLAERIRTAVSAEPVVLNRGQGLTVTISAGCASLVGGEGISAMVARADAALYEAKGAGRNRVVASTEPILT